MIGWKTNLAKRKKKARVKVKNESNQYRDNKNKHYIFNMYRFDVFMLKINLKNILFWCIFTNISTINHYHNTKNMFGNVVAVSFQIIFYVKMHANDVFLFFKNYF